MDMTTSDRYFTAVLAGGGMSPDTPRLRFFFNWQQGENTGAEWNPLATELPGHEDPVTPLWNPQGVRNYDNEADGVAATLSTLRQSNMALIWNSIIYETVQPGMPAVMRNTWGTTDFADWIDAGHNPFMEDFGVPWISPAPPAPAPAVLDDTRVIELIGQTLDSIAVALGQGTSFVSLIGDLLARLDKAGAALDLHSPTT